jgi:hypothetical protein
MHSSFCAAQSAHATPPVPHSFRWSPAWHVLSDRQQPSGHVWALHAMQALLAEHSPPFAVQSWQEFPPVPHMVSALPAWQIIAGSQQPSPQLVLLHAGGFSQA